MMGTFALAGGDEFHASYDEADRALIAAMPADQQRIVIIPTAAGMQGPDRAIANGIRHFQRLAPRMTVEGVLVIDAATAARADLAARIAAAGMVYLVGGDPAHLVRSLRGSEALAAIAGIAARGGVVAGSSAGAMALGETMRWGNNHAAGLGMIPNLIVLPHHANRPQPLSRVRMGLPSTMVALGIPVATVCMTQATNQADDVPNEWQVLGAHPVTIYHADTVEQVGPGETFLF
jgi:cyanophycinase